MKHYQNQFIRQRGIRWLASLMLAMLLMLVQGVFAQELSVTGTISDKSGNPIPGVNIHIKNTTIGAVSDANGKFSIKAPADATLTVSFVGYKNVEVGVSNRSIVDIQLEEESLEVDELVVVGYGVMKKSDLTGSVASVNSNTLKKSNANNLVQVLQGKASGITITTNSGTPGSTPTIRIRGVSTINNSDPIYVVDGLQVDNITFLNPNDIESIEILKDASACAIYGSRGSNGVILITSKRGKEGVMQVSVDFSRGISKMRKTIETLNASQWAMLKNEALTNAGEAPLPELVDYQSLGAGTNWIDEITRTGVNQNLNVSISGGANNNTYFLSIANNVEKGIISKTDFNRTSIRLNSTSNLKNWLTVGENLTLEKDKRHQVNEADEWSAAIIQALTVDPVTKVRDNNGNFVGSGYVDMSNPVASIDRLNTSDISTAIVGNIFADIKPFKELVFKSNLGINYTDNNSSNFHPAYHIENEQGQENPSISRGYYQTKNWNWFNTATYSKNFNSHSFSAMLGTEASIASNEWFGTNVSHLISNVPYKGFVDNGNTENASSNGMSEEVKMLSYFGRVNYSYNDKYLVTATYRRDGASNFGPDNRWGDFKSFSLGWNLHKEAFMSNLTFINQLKVRGGYGGNGNNKISAYPFLSLAKTGFSYPIGEEILNGSTFPSKANPKIRWEENYATNIGFDLSILNNTLSVNFDYYIKNTENMLVQRYEPAHVGIEEFPWVNAGSMQNKGIDLSIQYKKSIGNLRFELGANLNYNKNVLLSLDNLNEIRSVPIRDNGFVVTSRVDQPVFQFLGYKTDGLFQNQTEVDAWVDSDGNPLQPNAQPGDIRYQRDPNDPNQLYFGTIGCPLPDITYGFNGRVEYRNLDLSFTIQGVSGNQIFNATKVYTERPDASHNMDVKMLNRWTGEGTTNDAHYPRLNSGDANNIAYSDRYVEDGDYIRLKDFQIGYNLPDKLLSKMKLGSLRFYVGATNLITITKYSGFDPEIGYGVYGTLDYGVDRGYYPQARQFFTGISLTF